MIRWITNKIVDWFYKKSTKLDINKTSHNHIEIVNNISIELLKPTEFQCNRAKEIYNYFIQLKPHLELEINATPYQPLLDYADAEITIEELAGSKLNITYDWEDYFVSIEIENGKIIDIYGGD